MIIRLASAGDHAVLLEFGRDVPAIEMHAAAAAVRELPEVVACIVGQASLYVISRESPDAVHIREAAERGALAHDPALLRGSTAHRLTVSFADEYAPDLGEFLAHTGLTREQFFTRLRDLRLMARYLGFRAGFAYLDGWPVEWAMPRRVTSRPRVPSGSFGIAAAVAGFYPIDSPGGWNLLGRTDALLWAASRNPPNLIAPADTITIVPTLRPLVFPTSSDAIERPVLQPLDIIAAPLAKLVGSADWNRLEHGVAPGGPFDVPAARAANTAVGNIADAPLLECAQAGPRLRATARAVLSWFGADAEVRVNGDVIGDPRQFIVERGERVAVAPTRDGLRGYLASGSERGEVVTLARTNRLLIRALAGPHETPITSLECEVTAQLDRVGIRLKPLQSIALSAPADLPSCGMQFGTVQLHPNGSILAMGPDHPVTGGYLQPMTVIAEDRWKLAQLAPGERVRFVTGG